MAEQQESPDGTDPDAQDSAPRRRGVFGALRVVLILLVIVAAECAMAVVFFPDAEETAAMAKKLVAGETGLQLPDEQAAEETAQEEPNVELTLGKFQVSVFQPVSGTTLRLDFDLYCTVLAKDEGEFADRLEEHQHRLRDQIITILRGTDEKDLSEAGLGLIKRKLLETTNRTLGKAIVQEIVFSDFSHEEH